VSRITGRIRGNPNYEANVQIEKKPNHSTSSSSAANSSETKVAQEFAAIFPTRLALARWTRGGDIPHVHCFEHRLPMRAGWYEQAQRQFQSWLEAGGFHQSGLDSIDSGIVEAPPTGAACALPHDADDGAAK